MWWVLNIFLRFRYILHSMNHMQNRPISFISCKNLNLIERFLYPIFWNIFWPNHESQIYWTHWNCCENMQMRSIQVIDRRYRHVVLVWFVCLVAAIAFIPMDTPFYKVWISLQSVFESLKNKANAVCFEIKISSNYVTVLRKHWCLQLSNLQFLRQRNGWNNSKTGVFL